MSKKITVSILGAGASVGAGAPMMSNFIERSEDLLFDRRNVSRGDFESIINFVHALRDLRLYSSIDPRNIEDLYGYIEMDYILGQLGKKADSESLRKSLVKLISETIDYTMKFSIHDGNGKLYPHESYMKYIGELASAIKAGNKYCFISFNYDLALEFALLAHGIKYNYCLDGPEANDEVAVLKLHGSLNWVKGQNLVGSKISHIDLKEIFENPRNKPDEVLVENDGARLLMSKIIGRHMHGPDSDDFEVVGPVIIPPVANKISSQKELSNIWTQASAYLSRASHLHIIGYSMPVSDYYFKYLLAVGIKNSEAHLRTVSVVNPDKTVRARVEDMFERYIGKRRIFGIDYLDRFAPST